ncbi:MAG TPA: hypothetical protein VL197_11495 [Nitrospirota bacterium]|nr:hypothetical protein [Nitrospirota bacterium]
MVKVYGIFQITGSGEWKLSIEVHQDGRLAGFVERVRTRSGKCIRTRNLQGEVMEGECLAWLSKQTA